MARSDVTPELRVPRRALFQVATFLGASSTLQSALLMRINSQPYMHGDWIQLPLLNLSYWYLPALVAPLVMRIAVRYQLDRTSWWRQLAVHGIGALLYSVLHTATMFGLRAVLAVVFATPASARSRPFWVWAGDEYLRQFDWQLMTYLFLVGLAHALVYRRESERRALESAHLETRLVEAQLQALQRQLHPHFLFNTLNAIAGLIRTNVNAADAMIDQLGDLLRMALHTSTQQEVPLKQELEALRKYLDIEQIRLGSRLRVQMCIDPDTLDACVPNLLLQPLVENAVRHGIAPHVRPGSISVESERHGERLLMRVVDSGDGVPAERLLALNSGVGLANTRSRLAHLYPGNHAFAFANHAGGFTVTIEIPYRPAAVDIEPATRDVA